MKKLMIIVCSLLLLAAGCKPKPEEPTIENLSGNVSVPGWTNPAKYDYASSMTAVVSVDLLRDYPESAKDWTILSEDKLAAFMGDECCGVAELRDGLFWVFITEPENASETRVSLRYYSAFFGNLFEAKDAFPFQNDAHLGAVSEPLVPNFIVVK